ncbi:MAG: hypothetical protein IPH43_07820 [Xanthomonadales bacterium]|uniref:hypothetical protein n=1 Tax=Dokdonella sp. TaxID=2291710 RepID=UPI002BAD8A68|nr:hypothetical protein [Xanthomonadales bacterium]HQV71864.1 hypothetical protein [Dokdonella sp.]MBK7012575.1 hypothetical protein [Xanthomonadales bacterium]MBK7210619.1 hypothetical protein [Xanthomonadales bacterium]MBL0223172.1 hypothetical protein [Xanthomonadales bacterium]
MLRKGTLHARDAQALEDGSFYSMTLINKPPHGVMVWAGKLRATAREKSASEIDVSDYHAAEKVSFSKWADVWEYFANREYAELAARLRKDAEALYPGE